MTKFALAMLLVAAAGEAAAAAARVDFVYGNVTLSREGSGDQPLARGAELDNGDTVRTAEGRAQLRFSDGAYVSLQPHSEFAIRDYRFDGRTDGAERGFFGLARGAMRTVTGLVGRVNRDRYRVTTPTATIGIRGTGGVIQVLDDGSTLVVGTSGIWSLTNPSGSIDVPAGVSGRASAAPDAPPQRSSQAPQAGPAPLPQPARFTQGEDLIARGIELPAGTPPPPPPPPVLVSGSGYAAMLAYGNTADGSFLDRSGVVAAVFNASGQLTEATSAGTLYTFTGSHADFGTDGILAWGRWTGDVSVTGPGVSIAHTYGANQGLHYVVGMPTPVLPTQGVATYTFLGATKPTFLDGSAAGTLDSTSTLTVDFALLTVALDVKVGIDGRNYVLGGNARIDSGGFSGSTLRPAGQGLITASGCVSACSASVAGFFSGPNAERAGLGYNIRDDKQLIGAAAFQKQ